MTTDKKYYTITLSFLIAAIVLHVLGYFTNMLYFAGWFMWLPAIVLAVFAVRRILRDGYIRNPYIELKKICLTSEFLFFVGIVAYVIFNVVFCCYILRNGGGEKNGEIYYLINMGERIKEISADTYSQLVLAEYRMFTGHILFLYALILVFFRMKRMESEAV